MKTIEQYLSGEHDEELRTLVAEAMGWLDIRVDVDWLPEETSGHRPVDKGKHLINRQKLPRYPTSRDSCEELLADLTEEEGNGLLVVLDQLIAGYTPDVSMSRFVDRWDISKRDQWRLFRATARQICVAYLIVKGVLK